jgi:hypothetical protein
LALPSDALWVIIFLFSDCDHGDSSQLLLEVLNRWEQGEREEDQDEGRLEEEEGTDSGQGEGRYSDGIGVEDQREVRQPQEDRYQYNSMIIQFSSIQHFSSFW